MLDALLAGDNSQLSSLSLPGLDFHVNHPWSSGTLSSGPWSTDDLEYLSRQLTHQWIEVQADKTPHAIAVECNGLEISYFELNLRATLLAGRLRNYGVGPDVIVGLFTERSVEMVLGLLGILKAGGAYLPLDPQLPRERLRDLIDDAQIPLVLSQTGLASALPDAAVPVVFIDEENHLEDPNLSPPAFPVGPANLAYLIYTSGSTGKPKGVMVEHRSLFNVLVAVGKKIGITSNDRFLATTTISFDIAALEIFLPLLVGARVVLTGLSKFNARVAAARVLRGDITILQATPSLWNALAEELPQELPHRWTILCGGETLDRSTASRLLRLGPTVWNLYGPTETTIWSSMQPVNSLEDVISIGRPILNTTMFVLDANMQPAPAGVAGDLWIGGEGLARGYWRQPDLTAERFVMRNIAGTEQRLYKTGDRARCLPDGKLEFLGRSDTQIKLRGHRIELNEIEAVLRTHPDVHEAAAIARVEDGRPMRLVAYLVSRAGQSLDTGDVRDFLKLKLPEYMVPEVFVELGMMPLTPNGKLDRMALPPPDSEIAARPYRSPSTNLESSLLAVWCDLFHLSRISIDESFFDLGGNSIMAAQLVARIRSGLGREVSLHLLYEAPTIMALAEQITQEDKRKALESAGKSSSNSGKCPGVRRQRSWLLDRFEPHNILYSAPRRIKFSGPLNRDVLRGGLCEMARQQQESGLPAQPNPEHSPDLAQPLLKIEEVDLAGNAEPDIKQIWNYSAYDAGQQTGPEHAPLLRVRLLRLNAAEHLVSIAMHYQLTNNLPLLPLVQKLTDFMARRQSLEAHVVPELWVTGGA